MTKFDVIGRLKSYVPSLFELLGDNELNWGTIEKQFNNKFTELEKKYEDSGNPITTKVSFYGIITATIQGDNSAFYLFDFIDKLFQELTDKLTVSEKKLVRKNIFDLLVSMDEKFLNYLGELALLNQIIKSGNFRLLNVENPLRSKNEGSSIDFKLQNTNSGGVMLVEVVNVHLTENNTEDSFQVQRLLEQKLKEKYLKTANKSNIEFQLAPVLWGSHKWIKRILDHYLNEKVSFRNILTPSCFIPFIDSEGNPVYKFGTIDTIFETEK